MESFNWQGIGHGPWREAELERRTAESEPVDLQSQVEALTKRVTELEGKVKVE